jgi:hypothetical protein
MSQILTTVVLPLIYLTILVAQAVTIIATRRHRKVSNAMIAEALQIREEGRAAQAHAERIHAETQRIAGIKPRYGELAD